MRQKIKKKEHLIEHLLKELLKTFDKGVKSFNNLSNICFINF